MFKKVNASSLGKKSYSQCGEDLIMDFVLKNCLHINNPTYLDIGANDPYSINNTAYFYEQKLYGVCIEPDPILYKKLLKQRPKDKCLNIGVGSRSNSEASFFLMHPNTLNTFSESEAKRYEQIADHKIVEKIQVPIISINELLEKEFEKLPNIINIDTEGLDHEILNSLNFELYRPELFCIETLSYDTQNMQNKNQDIIELMESKRYFAYADTYINTIFVDKDKFYSH